MLLQYLHWPWFNSVVGEINAIVRRSAIPLNLSNTIEQYLGSVSAVHSLL